MAQSEVSQKFLFEGEIIEIVDKGGQKVAKIRVKPCYVETVLEDVIEAHLGDQVKIDAELTIEDIKLDLNHHDF